MADRGLVQAAGSWSLDACCAVHRNNCCKGQGGDPCFGLTYCTDRASSSDWLFGLWPGPPQRFEPTGTDTDYQVVGADDWPYWGQGDLTIGSSGAPGEVGGGCHQGQTYRGTEGEICGGTDNWGATDVEVWYPRTGH